MSWPKTVPVLNGNHICRESLGSRSGKTRCLWGWAIEVFGVDTIVRSKVHNCLFVLCKERGGESIAVFNDDLSNSKPQVSDVWNEAMHSLGYTEDA